jgi:outer membrane murein-binding lipoprotein Lpp
MSRHPTRTLSATAAALLLLGGCVKKSEYDALQIENQTLQTRVDQTNHLLVQSQADLSLLQAQMRQFLPVQAQLQKTQLDLTQSQEEFKALKTQFDQFRTQRRSAMVGKKFPVLNLEDGKVLREAEITAVSSEDLSIRHADGLVRVALAKTTPNLRWEACYDPQEAKEKSRENLLLKARQQGSPHLTPAAAPAAAMPTRNVVEVLRTKLATQRQALNTEYQTLAAKNPTALRGVEWNFAQPEASPLLNTLSGSRAVLGLTRLQSLRSVIAATLQQLREFDPAAR